MAKKLSAQPHLMPHEETKPQTGEPPALAALHRPLTKADIDKVRHIEGFPIGSDEDIIALSDPPYYTACPNPFLEDFVRVYGKPYDEAADTYHREPFAEDVSEGKNDPIYFAHYYSTKVPPHAIVPYILHYTEPGDLVFDGFSGTGMTGVAAQLSGDFDLASKHRSLKTKSRNAILADLSAAAGFISAETNSIDSIVHHLDYLAAIVNKVTLENRTLLETTHVGWPRGTKKLSLRVNSQKPHSTQKGEIEYIVWSDVFACPNCNTELVYWDLVFRGPGVPAPDPLLCPTCHSTLTIRTLERVYTNFYDAELGQNVRQAKQVPVLINYSVGRKRFEKTPDDHDLRVISQLEKQSLPHRLPIVEMPVGFNTAQPRLSHGFTHVHHFFTRRNLWLLSQLWYNFSEIKDPNVRRGALYLLTGSIQRVFRLNRYMPNHDRHVGPLSGTLYVSQLTAEIPATNYVIERINDLKRVELGENKSHVAVSTQSATDLSNIPSDSIDYIFTDPPFGGNLNYSELNILVEAWIGVQTNSKPEAIVNEVQKKDLVDYQHLMENSFREFYRILKPGRWITVEFHNSQNSVWNAIQEALGTVGYVIADVRTLDKQKGTTKQLSYTGGAVKQDLVISAYKPRTSFEQRFLKEAGTEQGAWDFVRQHLSLLPIFVSKNNAVEVLTERQNFLLFDRMVAFHIQRGASIPISAAEFYGGLKQRFPERDSMYFLPEQVAAYDLQRAQVARVEQLSLFVTDEKSAVQWLRSQLETEPQSYQDLVPKFLQGLFQARHERLPELSVILAQNFLQDSRGRWYVPDPAKSEDLEKLREKDLLREFDTYRSVSGRLKTFRTEAVRVGFKDAWDKRDYQTIVQVAQRLPEDVVQEDANLLMFYDNALMRIGG